tara:strand:- start:19823 stop:20179 length:357 start_codon:yes stop_codon:yes gene_type:complete
MTTSREHRIETRLELEETVFIEVLSAAAESAANVVMCSSLDLSANGIQVVVDEDIALGSILRLCIDMPEQEPIFLVGEVKWKRADTASGGICLGFLLFESDDSDIAEWKQWVADRLGE